MKLFHKTSIFVSAFLFCSLAFSQPTPDLSRFKSPQLPSKYFEVLGSLDGMSVVNKFGENPDIDTVDGFENIWDAGSSYVPPTQARIHNVASTAVADAGTLVESGTVDSATSTTITDAVATFVTNSTAVGDFVLNDTKNAYGIVSAVTSETVLAVEKWVSPTSGLESSVPVAGDSFRVVTTASTGIALFFVQGLDANGLGISEFIITNGTSNVATTKSYLRQFRAKSFLAGSGGETAGTISSTAVTDATVSAQVIGANNQTLMAVYTVPSNKIGLLTHWWGAISKKGNASSGIHLKIGDLDSIAYIQQARAMSASGSSEFHHEFDLPKILAPSTDIFIEADTDTNNTGIAAGFTIVLFDKVD